MNSRVSSKLSYYMVPILAGTVILVQLLGSYYPVMIKGTKFFASWTFLRIVIPIAVIFILRIPVSRIGLGLPRVDRKMCKILILIFLILIAVFAMVNLLLGKYFSAYFAAYRGFGTGKMSIFSNFMVFIASTIPPWEFMHRGFLLMGVIYALTEKEGADEETALKVAIVIVWIFEVIFHFQKNIMESLGLLAASPLLSYIAYRTRSIWITLLLHLLVEVMFIGTIVMH